MATMIRTSTVHILYRCRRHKLTIRRTFAMEVEVWRGLENTPHGYQVERQRVAATRYLESGKLISRNYLPQMDCPECPITRYGGAPMRAEPVQGRVVNTVKCNAKCINAVGPVCECSCGGENHGQHYANNNQTVG